ncbi:protein lethal(2)essential for life [Helicoverpa armigera]|uniref:SHSP domain-containing protein n=1 Tax=Helicoverpa armigera TaxID=29058 RepID=A0A2W1BKY7_HELAM|nr:protein lethal(2)essential for life [Helicoverpa armigera]PZC74335.1 hypothetical protein B5X24_HaOG207969 [Helicoverpa armigera]
MSLRPYFFDYDLPRWPRRLLDQNFGLTVTPDDLMAASINPISPIVSGVQPWWPKAAGSSIKVDKDKWQVNVDVQHFSPDEITVKISNGFIVVEGQHEEKQDEHGFISRKFVRRFKLPEGSNPDSVESRLSSDGILTVIAPNKAVTDKGERAVPITHTGPVRKEVAEEPKKE